MQVFEEQIFRIENDLTLSYIFSKRNLALKQIYEACIETTKNTPPIS